MSKKPLTWAGYAVILAAVGFCMWSFARSRNAPRVDESRYTLLTVGLFVAPVLAAAAIYLWYYYMEKAK